MNMRHYFYWARFTFTPITAAPRSATGLFFAICLTTTVAAAHPTALAVADHGTARTRQNTASEAWLKLPTIHVQMADKVFILSVARTTRQQSRGLMFIHSLPANRGMIFVFRHPCTPVFWMKNTYIPLDLIYVSATGVIRQHDTMAANGNAHHLYPSRHKILYAIEIGVGIYHKLGLKTGETIGFPTGFLKSTKPRS